MQYVTTDNYGLYNGMVDAIEAIPPDVGWYSPDGVNVVPEAPPTDEPGKWKHTNGTWEEYTQADKAQDIRQERDALISATDYLMMPDYPMSELARENLKVYRQALRDIPEQPDFPNSVVWPIKGE